MVDIKGPGVRFVEACIARPDIMGEATYMNWTTTTFPRSSRRAVSTRPFYTRPGADWPYLAMYELRDVAFTQGAECRKIRIYSGLLPNLKLVYDLADNNVCYYAHKQVFDTTQRGPGHTKAVIAVQIELKDDITVDD